MSAPDFVKRSPLANADGWVDVDKDTLQHVRFPNVFSLGRRQQPPDLEDRRRHPQAGAGAGQEPAGAEAGQPLSARYDGYTACPLVTGYGRLVMAEFDYDLKPQETFPSTSQRNAAACTW